MKDPVRIELSPLGEAFNVERHTPLHDVLFEHGVEFPCGGMGRCRGCRVQVLEGELPITPEQSNAISERELAAGWRMACRCQAECDLTLKVGQWEETILVDNTSFEFAPAEGLGVAIDLGTTTMVAQLIDLSTGKVLGVETAINPQARHGADIMSRVHFAVAEDGQETLKTEVRSALGQLIGRLLRSGSDREAVAHVAIVGNTVMHHLFCGIDVKPLAYFPFEPADLSEQHFTTDQLSWNLAETANVRFLACPGGFVGSDLLAGVFATRMHERSKLAALIDLGTNGEIIVGNREKLLCASTAAGPAFEGANLSMGMRATSGAISEVHVEDGHLRCHVLGGIPARGICGSGLVDAVAAGLELGLITGSGSFADGKKEMPLCEDVRLTQSDVRELQLAKGAIAAGLNLLLKQWNAGIGDLEVIYLAGAFGNYINRTSARRIGLLNAPLELISPSGNTALLGAKLALFDRFTESPGLPEVVTRMQHVSLASDMQFQEAYVEAMIFPD
jgi:uncharacterized 2Fe-2S/4Fe-4S cluster protein (DUF4445 family)